MRPTARHRSSATPLALLYAALIVYASWHPFSGWRMPSIAVWSFLWLPWPRWWTWFDILANVAGYAPLGLLAAMAMLRSGMRPWRALGCTTLAGLALTTAMEAGQTWLPQRVPSNLDWLLNLLGTSLGALLALAVHRMGWVERWQWVRDRWFIPSSAGGLVLLGLWPLALLFPTPTPLGLGHVADRFVQSLQSVLAGTAIQDWVVARDPAGLARLSPAMEFIAIVLCLLLPCLVAFCVSPLTWRRVVLVAGAAALGWLATMLSTALSFSPAHVFTWVTAPTLPGWVVGCAIALLLTPLSPRAAAAVGLVVVTAAMSVVNQAPADPYFAASLSSWEQGRFIRFHGLARWLGWLWPYAALGYFLSRVLRGGGSWPASRMRDPNHPARAGGRPASGS